MKGIPKSFAETIRVMAERPDVLQGYVFHIKSYQMGVSYLTDAVLNTFTGSFTGNRRRGVTAATRRTCRIFSDC